MAILLLADGLRGKQRKKLRETNTPTLTSPNGICWREVLDARYALDGRQGTCPGLAALAINCGAEMGRAWSRTKPEEAAQRVDRIMENSGPVVRGQFLDAFHAGQSCHELEESTLDDQVSEPGRSRARPRL